MSAAVAGIAIGAAGLGLAGAQAAGVFDPSAPPSIGQQQTALSQAQNNQVPATYNTDAIYNPKFAALNSTIAWQNLFGTPATASTSKANRNGYYNAQGKYLGDRAQYAGQQPGAVWHNAGDVINFSTPSSPGQLATVDAALPRQLAQQTVARTGAINDAGTLGPAAYQAIRAYDPSVTGLYDGATAQAQARLNTNGQLDPWTQMALTQNYRGAEAARGLAGGTSDAAMEAYYLASTHEQRQIQNINLAGTVANNTAAYYGDPFQRVINNTAGGVMPSPVSTTANQPNSVEIPNGAYSMANQNAIMQQQSQNAGWASQMGGIQALLSPGTASTLKNVAGYFSGSSNVPAANQTAMLNQYNGTTTGSTWGSPW